MIDDMKIPLIITLCNVVENGKNKCDSYWKTELNTLILEKEIND
jgi:hypothetical protein